MRLPIFNRCAASLWLTRHDPFLTQERDKLGRLTDPHVLIWVCRDCLKEVGQTRMTPKWGLLSKLRRQAGWLKQRAGDEQVVAVFRKQARGKGKTTCY